MSNKLRPLFYLFLAILFVGFTVKYSSAQERYWVDGSGSWNDPNHWAETSGGSPGAAIPTAENDVVFDDNSFTANGQFVEIGEVVECNNFSWQVNKYNSSLKSKSFLFKSLTKAGINVHGSVYINENIDNQFFGDIILNGQGEQNLNAASSLNSDIIIDTKDGEYGLEKNLTTSGDIILKSGSLNTNDQSISVKNFIAIGENDRSLFLGNSEVTFDTWNFEESNNLNLEANNSTLIYTKNLSKKYINLGGLELNSFKKAGAKASVSFDAEADSVICNGTSTGKITVRILSGTANYTYKLYDDYPNIFGGTGQEVGLPIGPTSVDTAVFENLYANSKYYVLVLDGEPSNSGTTVPVYEPNEFFAGTINVNNGLTCYDGSDAELEANPYGGTEPYTYQWYKADKATDPFTPVVGETSKVISGISKGFYRVWIKDANNCKDSLSAAWYLERGYDDINVPDSIHISDVTVTNTCTTPNNTGSISITASGGSGIAEYAIVRTSDSDSTFNGTGVFNNLIADTYKVYAIDAVGCIKRGDDVTLGTYLNPTAAITPNDPTICPGVAVNLNGNPVFNEPGSGTSPTHAWTGDVANLSPLNTVDPTYTGATNGVFNITYTVTDDNGCQASDAVTITVEDVTPPTALCKDITVQLDGTGNVTITGADVDDGSSDNCSAPGDLTLSVAPNSFNCGDIGDNVVTLTVTDEEGNSSTCNPTVTVEDNIAPVISGCPSNINQGTDATGCDAVVTWTEPTATDNCDGAVAFSSRSHAPGSTFPTGTTTVTYTFTDSQGNSSNCSFDVTINDDDAPVISGCPSDINQGTDATGCDAVVNWVEPTATDNCDGAVAYSTRSHAPGSTFAAGTTTVTYTFTDSQGNSSVCSFDVTITDDDAPVISGCPSDINQGTDATGCDAVVTWTEPTATDNCDGAIAYTTRSHAPGSTFATGTTTVTYTFTDSQGNSSICSFDVTITDDDAPVISGCPSDISQGTDGGTCDAVVNWVEPTANDNCDGAIAYSSRSHAPGSTFATGTTTVTYTFTDLQGNSSICSFDVTITDDDAPVISGCPSDINQGTDAGTCDAVVNWVEPTANDNCDGAIAYTSRSHAPGSTFNSGTTTVTYTFTDSQGNSSVCSFDVIITDDENPVVSGCPADINQGTDATGCDAIVTWTEPTANDNCDGAIAYTTRSHAPGSTFATGTTTVTYTFTDSQGNSSVCSFDVTITDDDAPVISGCPSDINQGTDATGCDAVVTWTEPTATDNCDGAVAFSSRSHAPGSTFPTGTTTVTYTFTDSQGNSSNCSFDVIITDDDAPVISGCPSDINQGTDAGTCDAVVNWVEPTANDNCDGAIAYTSRSHAPGSTFSSGTTTVTYTFTDSQGNSSVCSFDVIITDDENPVVSGCPADINQGTDAGTCDAVVNWVEPTANDNCDGAIAYSSRSHAPGSTFTSGTTTVTYTFTDSQGNSSVCSFDVIITDNENPVISGCPSDINQGTDATGCDAVVTWTEPTATDNCDGAVAFSSRSHAPGSIFPTGTTTVTYTFTDSEGNSANCSFDVTITDDDPPTITCPGDVSVEEDGSCSAVVNSLAPTANDNCAVVLQTWEMNNGGVITNSPPAGINDVSGETFDIGITTVTYHVEDAEGNFAECSFDVEVYDVVDGGLIDADQTICYNTVPAGFTDEASASVCGGFTYQWQMKSGTGPWTDIAGATNATYAEINPLTEVTYYNRKAISDLGFGTAYSDTITITIQPEPIAFAGTDTTLCAGAPYQIQDADTTYASSVNWEILTGNGVLDNASLIDPEYTPDVTDAGTIVELVLHANGIGPCGENTDTIRLNYLSELMVAIGKPSPYFIDSASTHIGVYLKITNHRFLGNLAVYLVSPLDSIVELKPYCTVIPGPQQSATWEFYNDSLSLGTINSCAPATGKYLFDGNWKEKLHGQDPANGAWRIRIGNNDNIQNGVVEEATLAFADTSYEGIYETVLYADSSVNITLGAGTPLVPDITEFTLPITGLTTSCFGLCDATAVATASGGLPPYDNDLFEWSTSLDFSSPFATGDTVDLCSGTYYVQVTDAHGCTAIDSVTVGEPPEIKITNSTVVDNVCYNDSVGEVTLEFSGGTGALTYTYDTYTGAAKVSGETFSGLKADEYTFTITDASGCTKDTSITIDEGLEITFATNVTGISCYGSADGQIEITGGLPGYLYSIDSASTWQAGNTFGPLPVDTFYVAVQDVNGCIQFGDTVELLNPDTITITSIDVTPYSCFGNEDDGEITINATGGVGVLWYSIDGTNFQIDPTFTSVDKGTYSVYVRDDCYTKTLVDTAHITGPTPITIDIVDITDVNTCYGDNTGRIEITASGGTGNFEYSNNGGADYQASNVFIGIQAGIYTLSVKDDDACVSPDSVVTVDQPVELVINGFTIIDASECNDDLTGSVTVNASGGTGALEYNVDGGAFQSDPTFTDLSTGTHTFVVRDANSCEAADDAAIVTIDPLSVELSSNAVTCFGLSNGSATATPEDGTTPYYYIWEDGETTATITNKEAGIYSVTITDSNVPTKCEFIGTVEIEEPDELQPNATPQNKKCITSPSRDLENSMGSVIVVPSGGTPGYTYEWDGPSGFDSDNDTILYLQPGNYSVTITDSRDCKTTYSTTLIEDASYDIPSYNVEFEDNTVCWNDNVIFENTFTEDAVNSIIFQISEEISPNQWVASNWEVNVSESPTVVERFINYNTNFDYIRATNEYCFQDTTDILIEYLPSFQLDIIDELDGNAEDDTIYLKGARTGMLSAYVTDTVDVSFEWYESDPIFSQEFPNAAEISIEPDSSAYYVVVATSDECVDSSRVYLEFIPAITPNEAFSPNDDGINDYWQIKFIDKFTNNKVMVFNRWGLKVFEQQRYSNEDRSRAWDGRSKNGKELPSGTYYYVIILDEAGFEPITGSITIIR